MNSTHSTASGRTATWEVFGRRLRLTNLDKALFPAADGEPPVTKRELIRYTARMAPVVLPYLAGRRSTCTASPTASRPGLLAASELPGHAPDWISRWDHQDADSGETRTSLVVDEAAALVWAANYGALEWHPWTSRTDQPQLPTYALIDIDPGPGTSWDDVLVLARLHRVALRAPRRGGSAQGNRATGHPDLDPRRRRHRASRKRAAGPSSCPAPSARPCPSW